MKKVAVFGSGNGSNFQAIIDYFKDLDIEFTAVSDKKDSFFLQRAKQNNIKNYFVPFEKTVDFLNKNDFDLIVLAGYMRILSAQALADRKIINIHPSLLPEFKGTKSIERAYNSDNERTGVTVHYVNEEVDAGEIIAQRAVRIKKDMLLSEMEIKIHKIEHILYPHVIEHLLFDTELCPDKLFCEGEIQ
ncbi:MAG: phosphoribosylglycinamide formyltransferase [bacterium]